MGVENVSSTVQHNAQNINAPKVTFFMLVTNRDVSIADYAVKSYKKVHDKFKDKFHFILYIYCNCLKEYINKKIITKWSQYNYEQLYDNHYKTKLMIIQAG